MGSLSGDLSERCGIPVQGANEAPADSTSVWLQRSPSTRTSCPRATSRRTTASIGGVFPPPSQCAKRKRLLAIVAVITAETLAQNAAPHPAAADSLTEQNRDMASWGHNA